MKNHSNRGVKVAGALLGALAVAGGCSTSRSDGTNTNWTCSADEDCADASEGSKCVAHECVAASGSGGKTSSGGAPGSGGRATGGGAPGGAGGAGGASGACVRAARSEPCQTGRWDCDADFQKEAYKYPGCQTFDGPYVRDCGAYQGLTFTGDDSSQTLFFAKSDGHLAGIGRAGMIEPEPACEWYDEGFQVPDCPFPAACDADRQAVVGRVYDDARDCYEKKATLPDVFARAFATNTTHHYELTCVRGPDGTRYVVWKLLDSCLEFPTSATDVPPWSVYMGELGMCGEGLAQDPPCRTAIERGLFDTGDGLGTGELVTADAGDHAVECP